MPAPAAAAQMLAAWTAIPPFMWMVRFGEVEISSDQLRLKLTIESQAIRAPHETRPMMIRASPMVP